MLATINRRRPCCRRRRSASHDRIANWALRPAHDAGARLIALVGVGAGAALPCDDPGRGHYCYAPLGGLLGKFVSVMNAVGEVWVLGEPRLAAHRWKALLNRKTNMPFKCTIDVGIRYQSRRSIVHRGAFSRDCLRRVLLTLRILRYLILSTQSHRPQRRVDSLLLLAKEGPGQGGRERTTKP